VQGRDLDGRSDVYAVGILLFEMLTGDVPFKGEWMSVVYQQVHKAPPALPGRISARLRAIIQRALSKDPDDRYPSAAAMLKALDGRKPPPPPWLLMAIATIALLAIVVTSVFKSEVQEIDQPPPGTQASSEVVRKAYDKIQKLEALTDRSNGKFTELNQGWGTNRQLVVNLKLIKDDDKDAVTVREAGAKARNEYEGNLAASWCTEIRGLAERLNAHVENAQPKKLLPDTEACNKLITEIKDTNSHLRQELNSRNDTQSTLAEAQKAVDEYRDYLDQELSGTVVKTEPIPYGLTQTKVPRLYQGDRKVVKAGRKGSRKVTYRITYRNGKEISRARMGDPVVVTQPRDQIVQAGTKPWKRDYRDVPIPFKTVQGTENRPGRNGMKRITFERAIFHDGKRHERTVRAEVVQRPVNRVVARTFVCPECGRKHSTPMCPEHGPF